MAQNGSKVTVAGVVWWAGTAALVGLREFVSAEVTITQPQKSVLQGRDEHAAMATADLQDRSAADARCCSIKT